MSDVVIVGGGVNGLMVARELALRGRRVTLLERGEPGREASWAGGGIVSPLYPWRYEPAITALAREARFMYPQLCAQLRSDTGIDPELYACGMLMLDAADADRAMDWAAAQSDVVAALPRESLRTAYPWLAEHWHQGLWMPAIANVRNPRLLVALREDLARRGVTISCMTDVVSSTWNASRVCSMRCRDGREFVAEHFVLAGGAWSAELLASATTLTAPLVRPVRGQMLLYKVEKHALPCIVLAEGRYVIPRRDGHVLCGSTLEEAGFDKSVTEPARASLQASAARLFPALSKVAPVAQWAGLRPATSDGLPYIGPVAGADNLWINAGQFRNGLVLAPASARLLAELMHGETPFTDPHPYRYLRS